MTVQSAFLFILLLSQPFFIFSNDLHLTKPPQEVRHVSDEKHHYLIEFKNTPQDGGQHGDWVQAIEKALDNTGKRLIEENLIAPPDRHSKKHKKSDSLASRFKRAGEDLFYNTFFLSRTITYPQKANYPFFTRRNEQFGSMGIYAPDGVPPKKFLEILKSEIKKQGVEVIILLDTPVYTDSNTPTSLTNVNFTYQSLEELKKGDLRKVYERELRLLSAKSKYNLINNDERNRKAHLKKGIELLDQVEPQLFWHQEVPTTGIRQGKEVMTVDQKTGQKRKVEPWKNNYPFLPHQFPLWELAPRLGEGVTVTIIDTGIAAFDIKNASESEFSLPDLRKNLDLVMDGNFQSQNYNLVSAENLNILDNLLSLLVANLDRKKYKNQWISYLELENKCIEWINEYHKEKQSLAGIQAYLKKYAFDLVLKDSEEYSTLLEKIENEMKPFHLVDIVSSKKKTVTLLELMPTAPILKGNTQTLHIAHGSHVAGIAAGRLQHDKIATTGYQPSTDEGICGIAPKAKVIMIKAFFDDGKPAHQSTIIAALIRAIMNGSHVVNMSLKTSDRINPISDFSKTLDTLVGLIPYCVASSGNDGDPHSPNYAGRPIEALPARISSVAFDVGSFGFDYSNHTCPVSKFSQYHLDNDTDHSESTSIGPKFLAPGQNILSCALTPDQSGNDSLATFNSGTSMSAPMISGFVALMLGEFKDDETFTRDQLLKVCYKCGIKMMDDTEWQQKSIFGSLDMRTVIFTLKVLAQFKKNSQKKNISFEHLLEATHTLLFGMANEYSTTKLNGVVFEKDFCGYYKRVQEKAKNGVNADLSAPHFKDLNTAINFAVNCLNFATGQGEKPTGLSNTLSQKMKTVIKQKTIDLFNSLAQGAHNRIQAALPSKEKIKNKTAIPHRVDTYLGKIDSEKLEDANRRSYQSYWHKQASLLGGA